jgi:hypothetical protein
MDGVSLWLMTGEGNAIANTITFFDDVREHLHMFESGKYVSSTIRETKGIYSFSVQYEIQITNSSLSDFVDSNMINHI